MEGVPFGNLLSVLRNYSFAAALSQQNVWVMNVVPVYAPDTLPIIFERGLVGIYHDWCESFGTYPRSYDLLHADHLFSRLKNRLVLIYSSHKFFRCKHILGPKQKLIKHLLYHFNHIMHEDSLVIIAEFSILGYHIVISYN